MIVKLKISLSTDPAPIDDCPPLRSPVSLPKIIVENISLILLQFVTGWGGPREAVNSSAINWVFAYSIFKLSVLWHTGHA